MQPDELKLVTASNLINLRTSAGLTQAQLGEMLNYSDKTISKWERADAIPDAYVLTQIADIFHVSVDSILTPHNAWEPVKSAEEEEEIEETVLDTNVIIAIAVISVWTLALTAFVALWLFNIVWWRMFAVALPVSVIVYMILICMFHKTRHLKFVVALFVLTIFLSGYFLFSGFGSVWKLFILLIPAEIIVFLSFRVKKRPKKTQ